MTAEIGNSLHQHRPRSCGALRLTPLVEVLEAGGVFPIHRAQKEDGKWSAALETAVSLLNLKQLSAQCSTWSSPLILRHAELWDRCSLREFNIGYDCGDEPFAFSNGLSHSLAPRNSVGAGLRKAVFREACGGIDDAMVVRVPFAERSAIDATGKTGKTALAEGYAG